MFWRPADGNETSASYQVSISSAHTPSVLAFSRQNLPQLEGSSIEKAAKGGYVVEEAEEADITVVSTGSEVGIAVDAAKLLREQGYKVRVSSLPCWEVFNQQDKEYQLSVLPNGAPIFALEAYGRLGWDQFAHEFFGLQSWGASGPYLKVYEKFGITPEGFSSRAVKVIDFYKQRGEKVYSPLDKAL